MQLVATIYNLPENRDRTPSILRSNKDIKVMKFSARTDPRVLRGIAFDRVVLLDLKIQDLSVDMQNVLHNCLFSKSGTIDEVSQLPPYNPQ